jgi:hypothetical protein
MTAPGHPRQHGHRQQHRARQPNRGGRGTGLRGVHEVLSAAVSPGPPGRGSLVVLLMRPGMARAGAGGLHVFVLSVVEQAPDGEHAERDDDDAPDW